LDFIENSDVVCISTLTSTAIRAYSIGQRLKAKGIPIIMGGVHPTFMPEEALQNADFVVRGEGEYSLPELYLTGTEAAIFSIIMRDVSSQRRNSILFLYLISHLSIIGDHLSSIRYQRQEAARLTVISVL
jgi:radical SAM superfamily enzyme YgiQ (UPF0313 family)